MHVQLIWLVSIYILSFFFFLFMAFLCISKKRILFVRFESRKKRRFWLFVYLINGHRWDICNIQICSILYMKCFWKIAFDQQTTMKCYAWKSRKKNIKTRSIILHIIICYTCRILPMGIAHCANSFSSEPYMNIKHQNIKINKIFFNSFWKSDSNDLFQTVLYHFIENYTIFINIQFEFE